ncbi:hypothetical protein HOA92_05435 [archaeon]|jgi:hypothetical protein|nr:hypothetical protein [archaeon]MBT6762455.1 hypothetical protein [archaeon]
MNDNAISTDQRTLCRLLQLTNKVPGVAIPIHGRDSVSFGYRDQQKRVTHACVAQYDHNNQELNITPDDYNLMARLSIDFLPSVNAALSQMGVQSQMPMIGPSGRRNHYSWKVDLGSYNPY